MSTTDTPIRLGQASDLTQRVRSLLTQSWNAFQVWQARQALRDRLSQLGDRELQDIGVTRGEIELVVRTAFPDPQL